MYKIIAAMLLVLIFSGCSIEKVNERPVEFINDNENTNTPVTTISSIDAIY